MPGAFVLAGCGGSSGTSGTSNPPAASTAHPPTTTAPAASAEGRQIAPGVVSGSASGVTATLRAGTHTPKVDQGWPISVAVTSGGRAAHASIGYEYLYAGAVVAHRSHYVFVGRFTDTLNWPASAVGYPLTFRAVVAAEGATIDLDYPVQVRR